MHRFWEDEGLSEEVLREQVRIAVPLRGQNWRHKAAVLKIRRFCDSYILAQHFTNILLLLQETFMKSRQAPSANVIRKTRTTSSRPNLIEVETTPLDAIPPSIIPNIHEKEGEDRDRIDIMGDISPATLPGVSLGTSKFAASSRPKKSLFAQQRDKKKLSEPLTTPAPSSFVQQQAEDAHVGILSDLVERDVISFDDHPIAPSTFALHEHGFPETEKVDLGLPSLDSDDEESHQSSFNATEPERVFYSSARDRLDTLQTVDVHANEAANEDEEAPQNGFQVPLAPFAPKAEFTALLEEISHDNDDSVSKMTPQEVERLQQELAAHLNPKFLMMLKERGRKKNSAQALDSTANEGSQADNSDSHDDESSSSAPQSTARATSSAMRNLPSRRVQFADETSVVTSTGVYSIPSAKKTNTKTPHANNFLRELERKKREWMLPVRSAPSVPMSDIPSVSSASASGFSDQGPDPLADAPYMSAERYRFDFEGRLLSFPSRTGYITVEAPGKSQDLNMLLHHGADPTQPGYTLDELHHLARSAHPSQRISAIRALGNIVYKAKRCYYSLSIPNLPRTGAFADFPNNLFLSHMMSTLGIGIAFRIALDDSSNTQILEALYALHALICAEADEAVASMASIIPGSIYNYPMKPRDDDNASLAGYDWDDKADTERCEVDLVLALLQTGLLSRLRYLLESKSSPITDTLILQIMLRMARHSKESCDHFRQCPGLLGTFKKSLSASASMSSLITALLIKVVKVIAQGSRDTCQAVIENGLIAPCLQRLYLINLDSLPLDSPLLHPCLETLALIETCILYGFLKSEVLNIIDQLLGFAANAKRSSPTDRKYAIQTAVWRIFTAMVPLARDIPEGDTIPGFIFLLSHVSPMVPLALASLRSFDKMSPEEATSDLDAFLASALEFLASYFRLLAMHPPRNFEDEIGQVSLIAHNNLAPFLISSPYFTQLVNQLSSANSWKTSPSFFNVTPIAPYALSLRSHPTLSWKALRSPNEDEGGGAPVLTTEQNLHRSYAQNITGSTLLHRASVLYAALRVVSAVNIHDPKLSAALTASEISGPLSSLLEHYSEWAMECSGSRGSVYGARVLHLLAYQCISLLYRASIVAQAAGLICLAHLMPGDEILAQALIQRTTLYYTQEEPTDLPTDKSLSKMLNIAPGTFAYLLAIINDGIGGAEPRSKRLLYLMEDEDHPADRESLHMDVEASAQPLGKYWIYNAFSHYAKHRAIEENELAFKKQQAKSDAVMRGLDAHFKAKDEIQQSQKDANDKSGIEDIQVELEGNMDLFGDYDDEESLKLLEAGRSLIRDSLQFALNVERSSTVYARHLKRSVKLNAMMQVFTLGPKFWLADEQIGNVLKTLLERFAAVDWEPARLDRSIVLNTAIIERVADVWANESFGDATIGLAISLWLSAGIKLTPPEILASGQAAELKSVDAAIWPHFATLWHLLPVPPKHLQDDYFSPLFKPLVTEYLLLAITSPHTPRMCKERSFWYRFIVFQLGQFFVSKSEFNQNKWIRLNSLQSLKTDLGHFSLDDQRSIFKDIFESTRDELVSEASVSNKKSAISIESVQDDSDLEYFLQEIRPLLFP